MHVIIYSSFSSDTYILLSLYTDQMLDCALMVAVRFITVVQGS